MHFVNTYLNKSGEIMKNPDINMIGNPLRSDHGKNGNSNITKFKTLAQHRRAICHFVLDDYKKAKRQVKQK